MGNKKKNLENDTGFRCLSKDQLALAATLAARHELGIPIETLADYVFGKRFIDLFAFDPDKSDTTGFRRVSVIESYLYLDKN